MHRVNRSHTISTGAPTKTHERNGEKNIAEDQELKKTNNLENLNETPRTVTKETLKQAI
jgi:hypothetical protein